MQEFDYSNETSNDLYDAVDGLSYEEAVFAKEAIEKIKEEKEEKKGHENLKNGLMRLFSRFLMNLLLFPDAALKLIRMRVAV